MFKIQKNRKKNENPLFFKSLSSAALQRPLSGLGKEDLIERVLDLEKAMLSVGRGAMDTHLEFCDREKTQDKAWLLNDAKRSLAAIQEVERLISGPLNHEGELYKYWFDLPRRNVYRGNNVLLTAISRACHSLSDEHTKHVEQMVFKLLLDARKKLSPECFKEFIAFRYKSPPQEQDISADYYFDNTPLTLAILSGMPSVAEYLLKTGLLQPSDIDIQTGEGYVVLDSSGQVVKSNPGLLSAAHLASLRFNITKSEADGSLLTTLKECEANFNSPDEYGHTASSLKTLTIPHYTADSKIRHNDMYSDYAHRLNYDSRLTDVCRQKDSCDPFATEIERHPDIFHPYVTSCNGLYGLPHNRPSPLMGEFGFEDSGRSTHLSHS